VAEDTRSHQHPAVVVEADILTFVIADVRGYTRFTQEHGDEAAARLAGRFAEVVRECVGGLGGQVVELRGDEALCVFHSPRSALRSAVALQRRCADELRADPSLPLRVGIGIDAGEAVPVEGGYRGGPLNLAARLCSLAKAGQVLISEGVVHLARKVDECSYVSMGRVELKGLRDPVRYYRAEFGLQLPAEEAAPRRWTPLRLAVIVVGGVVLIAAALAMAASRSGGEAPVVLGTNVVGVVDANGHISAQLPVGGRPGGAAADNQWVWVTNSERDSLVRINPHSALVTDIVPTGGSDPTGVAIGGGGVWVSDTGSGLVSWVNERSPSARVPQTITVGQGPGPIAFGDGGAWVVNTTDATVQRISRKLRVSRAIAVGGSPSGIAVGGGWVWVTDVSSGALVKIDPRTRRVVARFPVGTDPVAVTFGGGKVWVANAGDGTVSRLDPVTGQGRVVPVGSDPTDVAYNDGVAWVTVGQPPAIVRINNTLHVTPTPVASTPQAAVVTDGRAWITTLAPPASHRGGTLRVVFDANNPLDATGTNNTFDPGAAPNADQWQVLGMTNDGLVTYRRAGGAAGLQVVPDLAVAMPTTSGDGRTYTFQLRHGIHYSNGRLVRASDFRYALVRQFRIGQPGVADYYRGVLFSNIVGYTACVQSPSTCSFADGVKTDNVADTVTIRLSHPDSALLAKLATPFGDLVPPGSPAANSGAPVPATGPYMLGRVYNQGVGGVLVNGVDGFLLVRNPRFHEWSAAAQPDGYPNQVRWTRVANAGQELTDVEHGTADVMVDPPPPGRLGELSTNYATLAHPYATLGTTTLALATRVAPFNHVDVRRAVNYAIDRSHIVQLMGGPQVASPTCQVLPPSMFGYARYCPYTADAVRGGAWTAPNLARAQELVRKSGTRGDHVQVWTWKGWSYARLAPYLAHLLDTLGYHASIHAPPNTPAGYQKAANATANPGRRAIVSLFGWGPDYPNPVDFYDVLLTCRTYLPNNNNNLNDAEFCDPRFDQLVNAAEAAQTKNDPQTASLWQAADRQAVNQAPWVPLYNDVGLDIISNRVGNYQHNAEFSMLLDQLWVR
jgi:ABC-type transport system substrate-binding protein/class 3 adenylate cyclase/streptogramin lyase